MLKSSGCEEDIKQGLNGLLTAEAILKDTNARKHLARPTFLPNHQGSQMGFIIGGIDRIGGALHPCFTPLPVPEQAFALSIQHQFSGSFDDLEHLHLIFGLL